MAKEKATEAAEAVAEPEVSEFPVTLDEFLSEIPVTKVETKQGFTHICKTKGINGHKMRSAWQDLFTLYQTQPVSMTWEEWVKQGGKNNG